MIKLKVDYYREVDLTTLIFNGGESHVTIKDSIDRICIKEADCLDVSAVIESSNDLMELVLLSDIIRGVPERVLHLYYVPYARQDRRCAEGDAFSLKVFCKILNGLGFTRVIIADPHSDVTPALIDNVHVISVLDIMADYCDIPDAEDLLEAIPVSPDAGSNKKVFEISKLAQKTMIRADKVRSASTGEISDTIVYCDDLKGQDVTIWDDICDGGRTFIELAKKLKAKNAGKINLYVTHGIFSKGYEPLFEAGISHIYTTDSLNSVEDENVTIISLEQ